MIPAAERPPPGIPAVSPGRGGVSGSREVNTRGVAASREDADEEEGDGGNAPALNFAVFSGEGRSGYAADARQVDFCRRPDGTM